MARDSTDDCDCISLRSRRRFLATTAAGLAGLAGCSTEPRDPTRTAGDGGSEDGGDGDGDSGDGNGGGTGTDATTAVGRPLESWAGYDADWSAPTTSPLESEYEVEILVENLEIPWDLAFAPDGSLFITERVGRVLEFDGGDVRTVATPQGAIDAGSLEPGADERPWWVDGGEGGTLGIAVHPDFPDPSLVYVYYTYTDENDEKFNKVASFDVRSDDPGTAVETIVDGIPADNYHNGGRITFGPRNYLWITCGDGGQPGDADELSSLSGKILRVTPDGDPAPDNPDYDADGADRRIFTYGHRNPQGVVWLPDGTPVGSEHGPTGRDEINHLVGGDYYGWNDEENWIRRREQYPGSDVHKPIYNTSGTPFAPTGSLFYTGDEAPGLRNRMVTGALVSQQLVVTTITPAGEPMPPAENAYEQVTDADWSDPHYNATVHTMFENELGRIRHVEQGPDGDIYVCTSNRDGRASGKFPREIDDVLARIRPA